MKYNNFIYALNRNHLTKESISDAKSSILKFDWDGQPLEKLSLEQLATSFAYDPLNSRIYIYDYYKPENNVMYYSLQ